MTELSLADGFAALNRGDLATAGEACKQAYAENLLDEFTWDGYNANGGILPSHFFGPMRPRTFGIRTGISWD